MRAIQMGRPEEVVVSTDYLLRRAEVEKRVGLATTSIYRKMAEETFPQAIRVGKHAVRWSAAEIDEWLANRARGTDPTKTPPRKPA